MTDGFCALPEPELCGAPREPDDGGALVDDGDEVAVGAAEQLSETDATGPVTGNGIDDTGVPGGTSTENVNL